MDWVDFLVVGGGIAGLSAAIRLAEAGRVLLVCKEGLAESNTAYAQGGIAVAMGGEQDVALHLEDTLGAGTAWWTGRRQRCWWSRGLRGWKNCCGGGRRSTGKMAS